MSIFSWLGNAAGAFERQINPVDNNKTAKNKQGNVNDTRSTVQQVRDTGFSFLKDLVKPFVATGATVANTIGNAEVALGEKVGIKPKTGKQTIAQQFGQKTSDFIGGEQTPLSFLGNVAQVGLNVLAPEARAGVAGIAAKTSLEGGAARVATDVATGAGVGAGFGAAGPVADSNNHSITLENILKGMGYGAAGGALLGGVAAGIPEAVNVAKSAVENRVPLNAYGAVGSNVPEEVARKLAQSSDVPQIRSQIKDLVPPEKIDSVAPAIAQAQDTNVVKSLVQEANATEPPHVKRFVSDYGDALRQIDASLTGGTKHPTYDNNGSITGYIRTTEHTPFYSNFYKENGRKPGKADYYQEAQKQFKTGTAETFAQHEYDALNSPEIANLLHQPEAYFSPDTSVGGVSRPSLPISNRPVVGPGQAIPGRDIVTGGERQRGLYKTAQESKQLSPETKQAVGDINPQTYEQVNIAKSLEAARANIADDYNQVTSAVNERLQAGKWDAETSAHVQGLIEKANKEGRIEDAKTLFEQAAPLATQSGQANALWSAIVDSNSPEGLVKLARSVLKDANRDAGLLTKTVRKAKGQGEYQLDADTEKFIRQEAQRMKDLPDGPEKAAARDNILQSIADKIPPGASDKFDAFRYQNLLSSPRTQARNTIGNLFNTLITRPATIATESGVDFFRAGLTGAERTTYLRDVPTYYRGLMNNSANAIDAMKGAWRGELATEQPDLANIRGIRNNSLPKKYTVVSRLMEAQDRFFQSLISGAEYAVQKSKGVADDVALKKADEVAKYSLFRNATDAKNATGQGALLSKIDQFTNIVTGIGNDHKSFRWFVPFVRTPLNISKQFIEYSPAGFATLYKAEGGRRQQQLAKALIGSTITLFGAKAALDGQTTWAIPKSQKERDAFYAAGKKPYSINIGGKWIPMISFGPFAYALAGPAAMKDANDRLPGDASSMDKIVAQLTNQSKFFSQQTYVQGVANFVDLISGNDSAGNLKTNLASTFGQAIPLSGLQRYAATIVDPTFRKSSSFGDQLKSGIPGLSKSLEPYTDSTTGKPSTRNITDYVAPYTVGIPKGGPQVASEQNATQEFYRISGTTSKMRTKANDGIDKALTDGDFDKAYQIADDYNKAYAAAFKTWAKKFGQYENDDIVSTYDSNKINLTASSVRKRVKDIAKKQLTSATLGGSK